MIGKLSQLYCCEQLHNIENYEKAINDDKMWVLHHKLETDLKKTKQELIDEGLYYSRPANELIFLTHSNHLKLHHKEFNQYVSKHKGKKYKKDPSQNKLSSFWLFYDYVVKKMKIKEIAEQHNVNMQSVWYWMHKFGITKKLQKSFGQNL